MHILSSGVILLLFCGTLASAVDTHKQGKVKRSFASRKNSLRLMHQRRSAVSPDAAFPSTSDQVIPPNIYALLQSYAYSSNLAYPSYYPVRTVNNNGNYVSTPGTGYYPASSSNTVNSLYYPVVGTTTYPTSLEYTPAPVVDPVSSATPGFSQPEPLPVIPISESDSVTPVSSAAATTTEDEKDKSKTTKKAKPAKKKDDEDEPDEDEPDEEDFDAEDLVER